MSDTRLRVLHVFGRMMRGGAELRTIELAESFAGERVRSDFLVLSGLDGPLDERVRAAGGDVIKCALDARFPWAFARILRIGRYDVVHSHVHYFSGVILLLARLAGVAGRVAHFRTSVRNDKESTLRRHVQLGICRWLVHLAATDILAVGEGAMQGAWGPRWRADPRCRVVYNGIPPERLPQTACRSAAGPTIINVASLQPLKNQLRLIQVLRHCRCTLPAARLVLVGRETGDYGTAIRQTIGAAGLSDAVHLVGEVADALPWIAAADIMILPSLWEGLPGAALEACAAGVPVLASDLPGTQELARHFPSVTVMPLSEPDEVWAAAVVNMLRRAPSERGRAADHFAQSPFTVARAREAHYEIWSRSRVSA